MRPRFLLLALLSLLLGARNGDLKTLTRLLNEGADIEPRNPGDGWTPLLAAARWGKKGHEEAVTLLLARGAVLDARGSDGMTAAELAVKNGYEDMAKRLRAASLGR